MNGPLIEAAELAERAAQPGWVVVDCRFDLLAPARGREQYLEAHIPGARYADLDRDLARLPGPHEGRHPLPDAGQFAERLGEWGIDEDTAVVAYDAQGGAIAARLWWLLRWIGHERAYLLNGGLPAWQRLGLPLERTPPEVQPRRYRLARTADAAVVATEEIEAHLRRGGLLVDVRAPARYAGEQEPIDPVAGHVPGAVNRPFTANLGPDGRFLPAPALRAELAALLGGRSPGDVVAMCGSGVTACHLLAALAAAGVDGGRLYAGSWSEWIRDPGRPVRTGHEP